MLASLIMVMLLGQGGPALKPPQPNYAKYGSYSRQLAVYENAQRQIAAVEREKYRKFRQEVRLQTETPRYVIARDGGTRILRGDVEVQTRVRTR